MLRPARRNFSYVPSCFGRGLPGQLGQLRASVSIMRHFARFQAGSTRRRLSSRQQQRCVSVIITTCILYVYYSVLLLQGPQSHSPCTSGTRANRSGCIIMHSRQFDAHGDWSLAEFFVFFFSLSFYSFLLKHRHHLATSSCLPPNCPVLSVLPFPLSRRVFHFMCHLFGQSRFRRGLRMHPMHC